MLLTLYLKHLKKLNNEHIEDILYKEEVEKIHARFSTQNNHSRPLLQLQKSRQQFLMTLQTSLKELHFTLYYQPIVHLHQEKIMEAEVLLRWQHPTYGLISPDLFLPLCEITSFIVELGEWIFKEAFRQLKKWQELGYDITLAINLSAKQFNHPRLLSFITDQINQYQISPTNIKLEITESILLQNSATNQGLIQSLKNLGIKFSLDDFGTGYSSLRYLQQFPIDSLKIDKTFITDIITDTKSCKIVETVINLAKGLGLTVIAEGVEHEQQLELLKKLQCDKVQGYLFSKPISAADFTRMIEKPNQ